MSTDALAPTTTLTAYVASEIRAHLGRHSISRSELARRVGVDDTWVGKRLNGRTEMTLADLDRIASALNVNPMTFLPARANGDLKLSKGSAAGKARVVIPSQRTTRPNGGPPNTRSGPGRAERGSRPPARPAVLARPTATGSAR